MTAEHTTAGPGKRRGRRPAGQGTRDALMLAAQQVFTESGYEGATVRGIATRAGVDAAMVKHWFGSKEGLFAEAVLRLPFNPADLVESLLDGPDDTLGERIVREFLRRWDSVGGGQFIALVRSISDHDEAAAALRDFVMRHLFSSVIARQGVDRPELRATLCASQVVGMGMVRYVARFEPFASADIETLVASVAPNLQRYISGDIG